MLHYAIAKPIGKNFIKLDEVVVNFINQHIHARSLEESRNEHRNRIKF